MSENSGITPNQQLPEEIKQKLLDYVTEDNHLAQADREEVVNYCYEKAEQLDEDQRMEYLIELEVQIDEFIMAQGIILDKKSFQETKEEAVASASASVSKYLAEVTKYSMLTDAEAEEYIVLLKKDPTNEDAKNHLVFSCSRAMLSYALTRLKYPGISLEDIMNEGFLGIVENLDKWDITKSQEGKNTFGSFCLTCAKHNMYIYTTDMANLITVPEHIRRRRDYLLGVQSTLNNQGKDFDTFTARCAVVAEEMRQGNQAKVKDGFSRNTKIEIDDVKKVIEYFDMVLVPDINGVNTDHDNLHPITALYPAKNKKTDEIAKKNLKTFKEWLKDNPITVTDTKTNISRPLNDADVKTILSEFDGFSSLACVDLLTGNTMLGLEDKIGGDKSDKARSLSEVVADPKGLSYEQEIESLDIVDRMKKALIEIIGKLPDTAGSKNSLSDRQIGMMLYGLYTHSEFTKVTGISLDSDGAPIPNELYAKRETDFLLKKFAELWKKNLSVSFTSQRRAPISDYAEIKKLAGLPVWSIKEQVEKNLTPQQQLKFQNAIGGDTKNFYATLQLRWYRLNYLAAVGGKGTAPEILKAKATANKAIDKIKQVFTDFGLEQPPKKDLLGALLFLDIGDQEKVLDALPQASLEALQTLPFYTHKYTALNPDKLVQGYDMQLMTYEEIAALAGVSPSQLTSKVNKIKNLVADQQAYFKTLVFGELSKAESQKPADEKAQAKEDSLKDLENTPLGGLIAADAANAKKHDVIDPSVQSRDDDDSNGPGSNR